MSRHHPDLVMCRKQSGIAIGRLCDKCDGKCPVCDSYVRPTTLVRICDECSFGNYQNKCVVCGGEGISDAFYCKLMYIFMGTFHLLTRLQALSVPDSKRIAMVVPKL